jgi:DNA (cytosine-5)-methyltransferase 1
MGNPQTVSTISLCSGYDGIGIGLKRVIPSIRTIAYCERESYAIENLLKKIEEGKLDAAPICTDVKSFPYREFRGKVDIVTAGYPCKPFSVIGKRDGALDERHLWPYIANGIRDMQPAICFLENVAGHITLGLSTVISDLAEMGYKVRWGLFGAAEIGAPHERKRIFVLATLDNPQFARLEGLIRPNVDANRWTQQSGSNSAANLCNWRRVVFASELGECDCCGDKWCKNCGTHYADCKCYGPNEAGLEYIEHNGLIYAREELKWPNYPQHPQKQHEPPRLLTPGKSQLGGGINGLAYRVDRHILIGNGVIPDVAEKAFCYLWRELNQDLRL